MSLNKYLKYKIKYYNLKHKGGTPNVSSDISKLLNGMIDKESAEFEKALEDYNKSSGELVSKYQDLLALYELCNKYNIACNIKNPDILNSKQLNLKIEHITFPDFTPSEKPEEEFVF